MLDGLLNSERAKWIFVIGIVAAGAGIAAKNVISYPTECMTEELAHISEQHVNPRDSV